MRKHTTFVMKSEKVKALKQAGFTMDEIIIFKEELGKAKKKTGLK